MSGIYFTAFIAILLTCSSAAQLTAEPSALLPVTWTPSLQLDSLAHIDERLRRSIGDTIEVQKNGQRGRVTNCVTALQYLQKGYAATNDQALRRWQSLNADCRTLELLKSSRPSRRSALTGAWLEPAFLPPTLGFLPSDEELAKARAAQSKGLSWKELVPTAKVNTTGQDQVSIENGEGVSRLQVYARCDCNGDGIEDVILRADSYPNQGTYVNTRLFLLTRFTKDEVLRVLREYDGSPDATQGH